MVLKLFNKDKLYVPGQEIDGYTVIKTIGEGRYGICYLVCAGGTQFILKQLKRNIFRKTDPKAAFEAEILTRIQHPCLPGFIKKIVQGGFAGYLLEFKAGKTFEEIIFEDNRVFERQEIYNVGAQLINIIKYLHGIGVVHRDIRVPNTLYNNREVYLIDFGLARWINDKKYTADTDFSYLGDFLLHLYYTSYENNKGKSRPWYEELDLFDRELLFLKRLLGIEEGYNNINEVERDFLKITHP